jgi:hypothetical protein
MYSVLCMYSIYCPLNGCMNYDMDGRYCSLVLSVSHELCVLVHVCPCASAACLMLSDDLLQVL